MIVNDLPKATLPTLKPTDTVGFSRDCMLQAHLFDLALVDEQGVFVGMIAYDELEEFEDEAVLASLSALHRHLAVGEEDALLAALQLFDAHGLTALAVVAADNVFVGQIQIHDLPGWMAAQQGTDQPGGTLALRIAANNYSLSEIARIVESNNGTILQLSMTTDEADGSLLLQLKINLLDLTYVMATFERFGYQISSFTHQSHLDGFYTERYDALMRYLDL